MVSRTGEEAMMRAIPMSVLSMVLALMVLPVQADSPENGERLRVGKTNIYCVMAPCPWRGIWRAKAVPLAPADLVWAEQSLPRLTALPADAAKVTESWNADTCIEIEGALTGSTLVVDRIVGDCS